MAARILPLGHKKPGFQHATLRREGKPTARGRLLLASRKQTAGSGLHVVPAVGASHRLSVKTKPGRPVTKPLGQKEISTALGAEAIVGQLMARQHASLGQARGKFATKHGNSGRPPYAPGLARAVIVQPLTSPYRSRFTFGPAKF